MALSVDQLLRGLTKEQALAFLLNELGSLGFNLTSWHEGSVQLNLLEAVARGMASVGAIPSTLVRQVLVKPEGLWLDARGLYFLQLPRLEAVKARRAVTITSAPSAPVHVIDGNSEILAGQITFRPFELLSPVTLNPGDSVTITVEALIGGVGGNTREAPTALGLGGTVSNWSGNPTTPGVDVEGDERYRLRQDRRLSELTYSVGLRAYELWALTGAPSVKRARAVNHYPTVGTIAIALDPGTPEQIAQVEAFILGRNPPNDIVVAQAANVVPYTIALNPRVRKGVTEAQLIALLDQVVLYDMPIGGWLIAEGVAGRLLRERLSEALLCKNGAYSAGIVAPATDLVLGPTDVIAPTYEINLEFGVPQ